MLRSHHAGFPRVAPTAFGDDNAQGIGDVEICEVAPRGFAQAHCQPGAALRNPLHMSLIRATT